MELAQDGAEWRFLVIINVELSVLLPESMELFLGCEVMNE